jgi:phosphatidylglycerol lysyltransferase
MACAPVPSQRTLGDPADHTLVRRLLAEYGWNTTCFQVLNPGIEWWISQRRDAMVGYVTHHGTRVVAGAPICPEERLCQVIDEFEEDCRRRRLGVCYFGAEGRMRGSTEGNREYSTVSLGAQPFWSPQEFIDAFGRDQSLRQQLNRSRNKKVTVTEWDHRRARENPELRRCLAEWLETRGLPPMHFLVEPETLDELEGRRIFVAERNGSPVGFTVLSPVPCRNGYLTEQFVRGWGAPNGTVELCLYTALSTVCKEGAEYVTMGIVPLSHYGEIASKQNPAWLRLLAGWVRAHGRRFYNFDGLDAFKSKFQPAGWEPIYVIAKEPKFSFKTLYAIAEAFSECSPLLMVFRGLVRAVKQELRWLVHRSESRRTHPQRG